MKRTIVRLVLRIVTAVVVLALTAGCTNWLFDVVQSFGTPNGPKISTVAGDGKGGYSGDAGPATSAEIYFPEGVAVDGSGNFYIADSTNCLIREVNTTTGIITTVAGTPSVVGSAGDGGSAISAELYQPGGVALDSTNGDIYIADTFNQVIRMVSSGIITTVAGIQGASGSSANGIATSKKLSYPASVAVDGNHHLYIADQNNNQIREVSSGNITLVAGNGLPGYAGDRGQATSAGLFGPYGVAVDATGRYVYIADTYNNAIRMVDNSSGIITTIAGNTIPGYSGDGGPATAAELNNPEGIAVDSAGNVYVSDVNNSVVRKIDTSGIISTVAGNYHLGYGYTGDGNVATAETLYYPWGIAVDSAGANLYIADNHNHRIRKVAFGN